MTKCLSSSSTPSSPDKDQLLVVCPSHIHQYQDGYIIGWKSRDDVFNRCMYVIAGTIAVNSYEKVEMAIDKWKIYMGKYWSKESTFYNQVVKNLTIIAVWGAANNDSNTQEPISIVKMQNSSMQMSIDLRLPSQVILFDSCRSSLDCYRHCADQSLLYDSIWTNCTNEKFEQSMCGWNGDESLQNLLLRINETNAIMHSLRKIVNTDDDIGIRWQIDNNTNSSTVDFMLRENTNKTESQGSLIYLHYSLWKYYILSGSSKVPLLVSFPYFQLINSIVLLVGESYDISHCPREVRVNQRRRLYNRFFSTVTDVIIGLVIGWLLLMHTEVTFDTAVSCWTKIHGYVWEKLGWLETFPVGFKLNVPLTKLLGKSILSFTKLHEQLLVNVFTLGGGYSSILTRIVGYVSIFFGARTLISITYDFTKAITFHFRILEMIFRTVFLFQLSLFSSLWHLFRGKKKNILRKRSDSLQYDFMQLFLGMILFSICLFLFTTVFVYTVFFTLIGKAVCMATAFLKVFYNSIAFFPIADIILAIFKPNCFKGQITFRPHKSEANTLVLLSSRTLSAYWILVQEIKVQLNKLR